MSEPMNWDRRRVLQAIAAGGTALLPACDVLDVKITNNPDAILYDDEGRPFIPPITEIQDFYKYQCCGQPAVDPDSWELRILDRGELLATLNKAYLETLPVSQIELTLECIGASPRSPNINNATWGGMPLQDVIDDLGISMPDPSIREIRIAGVDGYHASLPVTAIADAPIWLVWQMNGEPLPEIHGHPARLMVPGRYGIKNIKWIQEIEFVDEIWEGFWDTYGWNHEGNYLINGYILLPAPESIHSRPVHVLGTAFAGKDPVTRVEITSDGGETWSDCEFDYAPGPNRWVLWRFLFDPSAPGEFELRIRCTSESGAMTAGTTATNSLNGFDGGQAIRITVT